MERLLILSTKIVKRILSVKTFGCMWTNLSPSLPPKKFYSSVAILSSLEVIKTTGFVGSRDQNSVSKIFPLP